MKKTLITILCLGFMITSCDVDENLNRDTKNPTQVPAEGLFTNGTRNFFDLMHTGSVNVNVFRLYAQYWAQTTYPDESQYNQVSRNIGGNMWDIVYRDVLQDLKGAKEIISAQASPDQVKLAQIEFMQVYAYSALVDIFGNVPYTDALDPTNPSPSYDDAATIYGNLLTRLDAAIAGMNGSGGFDAVADPVYNGDVSQWQKAATSLKLRLAMRIRDGQLAQSAAAGSLILDNSDNFAIEYFGGAPNTNPLWVTLVQSGRTDFVGADTFVDELKSLNDPRLEVYFQSVNGEYIGGVYGSANSPSSFSLPGTILEQPDLDGDIITASEVHFLLAEAVARNYSVGGTAQAHYEAGVTASFLEWGLTEAQAQAYLAQPDVAWATAPGDDLAKIAKQKWIALYNNAFEGWTTWRILDSLPFQAPEGMTLGDIPTRFLYPASEATLNPSGYEAAASAIGGDTKTNTIFWDID
ncbi:SusD/RagB family nutrient-binding outer membrane lipoprotein [Salinimicrobium gaetbulicola]|uniref:SusD/RagB family nutrient-binding outer membrane lipoprotein n=1 Tax=Salinimicrobium gaetbulicola TaxID=999702 RepID=A0ABW3II06_9FLAO